MPYETILNLTTSPWPYLIMMVIGFMKFAIPPHPRTFLFVGVAGLAGTVLMWIYAALH